MPHDISGLSSDDPQGLAQGFLCICKGSAAKSGYDLLLLQAGLDSTTNPMRCI